MKKKIKSIYFVIAKTKLIELVLIFFLRHFKSYRHKISKFVVPNQEYSRGTMRQVFRYDIQYLLDLSDYQEWLIFFYQNQDSSFGILEYVAESNIIIDVGGNIGQTALMVANKIGKDGLVYAFEPYPPTYEKFINNLSLNPKINNIKIYPIGIGKNLMNLDMFQDCITNSGANRVVYNHQKDLPGLHNVTINSLDTFVRQEDMPKIDLIKIDVEGFEMNVLLGAIQTLKKYKPGLYIEIDDDNLKKQGSSSKEVINFLKELGYIIYSKHIQREIPYLSNLKSRDVFLIHQEL